MNAHTLTAVLQPRPCNVQLRCAYPAHIEPGTAQDTLVDKAAAKVRSLYQTGQRYFAYDDRHPELFQDACADTYQVAYEVEQAVADDLTARIAMAIFERAGFRSGAQLRPTTLSAQVRMQVEAMDAAHQARQFFATQASLC